MHNFHALDVLLTSNSSFQCFLFLYHTLAIHVYISKLLAIIFMCSMCLILLYFPIFPIYCFSTGTSNVTFIVYFNTLNLVIRAWFMPRTIRVTGCIAIGSNDLDCGLLRSNSSMSSCKSSVLWTPYVPDRNWWPPVGVCVMSHDGLCFEKSLEGHKKALCQMESLRRIWKWVRCGDDRKSWIGKYMEKRQKRKLPLSTIIKQNSK
jgi:hypothetical protein